MATTVEQLQEAIEEAATVGFRRRLLARGQARSIIWRGGELPPGAPPFARRLSYDLLSYGYSLLGMGLRLRELEGDPDTSRQAFEQAAGAIESVIARGDPTDEGRGFHRVASAAAYHLGRYSARSYSLLVTALQDSNLSLIERALGLLILRNFKELLTAIIQWRVGGPGEDAQIYSLIETACQQVIDDQEGEAFDGIDAVDHAITDNFLGALATFLLAIESGDNDLVRMALDELQTGLGISAELNLVPQWWMHRLAIHLLNDLWSSTFHVILPDTPQSGDEADWQSMRQLFISLLYKRSRAEIDLWPSQLEGASRAVDQSDDLVVSLPTSAGKTRIAELCILRCLSQRKRIIFVTPLRALSAQTEVSLRRTFLPLGKTISTLYGSIGTSGFEQDALRARDIVVATPEKLDFALRNDPSIIDDVGLVVLDEGHMIGLGEREVRYEVQIQRLLRREDADQRRIVCLSAVLPHGEQFDDFVNWLRRDRDGEPVEADWRPTRLRYGEVIWDNDHARLNLRVGEEQPFVPNYFRSVTPTAEMRRSNAVGVRTTAFPRNQRELVLATAWRFVQEGQSVLIYCPERRSVEPYARAIAELYLRGLVDGVLESDETAIATAKVLGEEWLGENHPIIRCLELGVAIHHGALPTPFRKEIEKLLRDGVLKITVSSPTLAQGLNLSATAIIMHDIEFFDMSKGSRELIKPSDFQNIIGRADRAFVDIEGLVLYPMFNSVFVRQGKWENVIDPEREREMESGLVRLVITLLVRLHELLDEPPLEDLIEYVVNNADAWVFRGLDNEDEEEQETEKRRWQTYLSSLDTAILSLLGETDCESEEIAEKLDEVLGSSLWQRRLARREEYVRNALHRTVEARAQYIWGHTSTTQRKGYFLAGVGFDSGQKLDAIADEANELLVQANGAILTNDQDAALEAITTLAEKLFAIPPFVPEPFPENWRDILDAWLKGKSISRHTSANATEVLRFVEGGLIYRLPWGMEAIRVRAGANGDVVSSIMGEFTFNDFEMGLAVPAVESGTLNLSAALLMQAGFTSRLAAIKVVEETGALFSDSRELSEWLKSEEVVGLTAQPNWPTAESSEQWRTFVESFTPREQAIWKEQLESCEVDWEQGAVVPNAGARVRLFHTADNGTLVLSPNFQNLGKLRSSFANDPSGLLLAIVSDHVDELNLTYLGPDDLRFA